MYRSYMWQEDRKEAQSNDDETSGREMWFNSCSPPSDLELSDETKQISFGEWGMFPP